MAAGRRPADPLPDEVIELARREFANDPIGVAHLSSSQLRRTEECLGHLPLDIGASMAVCRALIASFLLRHREQLGTEGVDWLVRTAHPIWREIIISQLKVGAAAPSSGLESAGASYDWACCEESCWATLSGDLGGSRRDHGVYYTPREIVDFLVADSIREYKKSPAFATLPMIALDPAAGGGRFVASILAHLLAEGTSPLSSNQRPSSAERCAIPGQLAAYDIRPSALCATQLEIAQTLCLADLPFSLCDAVDLRLGDTLRDAMPHWPQNDDVATSADTPKHWLTVIGNPPFDSRSRNASPWISSLLRGEQSGAGSISYTIGADATQRPKKHWLDDDYVKFLRYAHWRVDNAGCGTIAFVLGNGLVDNSSFAVLRSNLQTNFDRVAVVNLHGAAKRGLVVEDGTRDESVFGIEQGVALLLLTKLPSQPTATELTRRSEVIFRCDLRGSRVEKMRSLAAAAAGEDRLPFEGFATFPPQYVYEKQDAETQRQFSLGIELSAIFRRGASAIVTARDTLVIARTKRELVDRMKLLVDESVPSEVIREQFFPRARSRRYQKGDTRSWTLEQARERLRSSTDWEEFIVPVDYRPWDRRYILYIPWMVDWPRHDVTKALLAGDVPCLVTRRQMVPERPANFFWVTQHPTVDGVIRSDNRGNETLYPLRISKKRWSTTSNADQPLESNLAPTARSQILRFAVVGSVTNIPREANGGGEVVSDIDFFDAILAQLFSPTFQMRFAQCLWHAPPRVFPFYSRRDFERFAQFGRRIREVILQRPADPLVNFAEIDPEIGGRGSGSRSRSRYVKEEVIFENGERLAVPVDIWDHSVGSHHVARKWLREYDCLRPAARKVRFAAIVAAVRDTLNVQSEIDNYYAERGGFAEVHRCGPTLSTKIVESPHARSEAES